LENERDLDRGNNKADIEHAFHQAQFPSTGRH